MKLSELLPMIGCEEFEIIKEKEFVFFALSSSILNVDTCIFIDDERVIGDITNNVKMVLTNSSLKDKLSDKSHGVCVVDNPRIVFFQLHNYLSKIDGYKRKKEDVSIGKNCKISPLASIAKYNVTIGDDVVIEEFVVIRENTTIGKGSIIRAGVIIGGQGFEYKRDDGAILSVKHVGGVHIGDNVEVRYNTTIDCGLYPWDDTVIENNCKIDNLVYIAHGVKLSENVLIAGQSGVFGRSDINENTWIGASAVISNGIKVGANASVNIGAIVTKDVEDGISVTGNFAIEHNKFIRHLKEVNTRLY